MTEKGKNDLYRMFLSFMLTIIIGLVSYIGYGIQKQLDRVEQKINGTATIQYVDKQDDYLRMHILESYRQVDEKLDFYIKQNNKIKQRNK